MLELSVLIVSFVILAISAYTDLTTLEVPDWLNYSGIAIGLGIHIIFSATWWSYLPLLSSIAGLAIAFALSCLMFYTGQWGGGDAKLLMAMGALFGFELDKFAFGTSFLINLVFIGGIWGLLFSIWLAALHGKKVVKTFFALRRNKKYEHWHMIGTTITFVLIVLSFFFTQIQLPLMGLALLCFLLVHLALFMKTIELVAMHRWVLPDKLTEGDWLVHAIRVGKQILVPPKLGLEKKELVLLRKWHEQKKIDKVLVRYGVPFTPAFLLAFLATLAWGNVFFMMVLRFIR